MINIENIDDNECFKWCLVRYLDRVDHNPKGITKAKELDFKDIIFPIKATDIQKLKKKKKKKNSIGISVFGYENKETSNLYIKKFCEDKHVDLLLIREEEKRHYVLISILIHLCMILH